MASSIQIIPFYAQPHVHTVIYDHTWYEETVANPRDLDDLPFATCVVTGADSGIDNTFVRINTLGTKQTIFGKGNYEKYGQSSIQADTLFNGQTNVWFCRVLPDNATYANMILLAHFRTGNILDSANQPTGLKRFEIKFSWSRAVKPYLAEGAKLDTDIDAFAKSVTKLEPNPSTGYMTVPLYAVRSIGRGQYGNKYSLRMERATEEELEFKMKMYRFVLLTNDTKTRVTNQFAGSLYQTSRYEMSTLIDDVLDQFTTGSCPIHIKTYEEHFVYLVNFYKDKVVALNRAYLNSSGATEAQMKDLKYAEALGKETFDPVFGIKLNVKTNEPIPYYRNYTVLPTGPWVPPNLTIPDTSTSKPSNISAWTTAVAGAKVLVITDPLHDSLRWLYTVDRVDATTGDIIYDEGHEVAVDADQYDGTNISLQVGARFAGGHDGDFQDITIGGVTRPPTAGEMLILLSKEYVRAFRGEKDRKILSPARVNLDYIFDANYNMTSDEELLIDRAMMPLYAGSTILTDADAANLAILWQSALIENYTDLNVKKAMFDLNEFRNKNGMTIDHAEGAGCLLHLDMNMTGLRKTTVSFELLDIINMMSEFLGRNVSIDLGHYEIFDPVSGRRVKVTATYFLAQNLIPHMMKHGINKPFTYNYAQLTSLKRNARTMKVTGNMIRDTFRPDLDLIDWDVKEMLYLGRINYYVTTNEGRIVQRAVQNTRQLDASALLEENNVRVLNVLKKGLDKACMNYLYEWNEPEVRRGYTEAQMEVYRPWIGTMVHDIDIVFTANEWEQERMIMHCLVYVAFRDIVKRIILEINIARPDYETGGMKIYDYGGEMAEKKYGRKFDYSSITGGVTP